MPYLRDFRWRSKYDADAESLVGDFYVPALLSAERYDRSTGFFSAGALLLAARGIEGLVRNSGRMRLVVGCTIEQPEADAIEKGLELRQVIEDHLRPMPLDPQHPEQADALELLAWMVERGHLEVRLAVPCDASRKPIATQGIFHEKAGVIEDRRGDRLAFNGSINETFNAWSARNWESFHVFTDWESGKHVDAEDRSFAELWNDKKRNCRVVDLPEALKNDLLRFLPSNDQHLPNRLLQDGVIPLAPAAQPSSPDARPSADELRSEIWRFIATAPNLPNGGCYVGERTSIVEPWPHQVRAFHRLYDHWPPRVLIADEVGLGKTIEAGLVLRQAMMAGRLKRALILAPKAVLIQWQIELREKFNLNWPIYDGASLSFYPAPALGGDAEQKVTREAWHQEPFVITSSQLMRRADRANELLQAENWDLILLDEAHHARRRGGFGSTSKGPNQLLNLMQRLNENEKAKGLLLLTATPMQVDPAEVWDLLALLGLPKAWTEAAFTEFFERASRPNPSHADFESMSHLFRAAEAAYGEVAVEAARRLVEGGGQLRAKKVLSALRDPAATVRKMLSPTDRAAAVKVMMSSTPVSRLVSRHTRELLRRYFKAGKIRSRIADREVVDLFVPLSAEERLVYTKVETYISTTFNQAAAKEKNAVGFVMTIYRRRLASSFHALERTLSKRLNALAQDKLQVSKEDLDDGSEAFWSGSDQMDEDEASKLEREALALEEKVDIADLVRMVRGLPTDTKAQHLLSALRDLREEDYRQVLVFTQYTDTLDFLRNLIVEELGLTVLCYSGRGGEARGNDGQWHPISREETKRRFRRGDADILLCSDAASEGLNFQFCGALVNYDMPWNPMRVEQRIGRIDRLGQEFEKIRIVNLHYADTVEADVYEALRQRIQLFTKFVGKLQPILAKVPKQISDAVLRGPVDEHERKRRRLELEAEIKSEQEKVEQQGFDLDAITESDVDEPKRPEAPYSLADLKILMTFQELLPAAVEISDYSLKYANLRSAAVPATVRVTADAEFFDEHPENCELWSPGSKTFPELPAADAAETLSGTLRDLLDRAEAAARNG